MLRSAWTNIGPLTFQGPALIPRGPRVARSQLPVDFFDSETLDLQLHHYSASYCEGRCSSHKRTRYLSSLDGLFSSIRVSGRFQLPGPR